MDCRNILRAAAAAAALALSLASCTEDGLQIDDIRAGMGTVRSDDIFLAGLEERPDVGDELQLTVFHGAGLDAEMLAGPCGITVTEGLDNAFVDECGNGYRLRCVRSGNATIKVSIGQYFKEFHIIIGSDDETYPDHPEILLSDRVSISGIPDGNILFTGQGYTFGVLLDGMPCEGILLLEERGSPLPSGTAVAFPSRGPCILRAEVQAPDGSKLYCRTAVTVMDRYLFTLYVGSLDDSSSRISNCGVFAYCSGTGEGVRLDILVRAVAEGAGRRETRTVYQSWDETFRPGGRTLLATYSGLEPFVMRNLLKRFSAEGEITVKDEYSVIELDTSYIDEIAEKNLGYRIPFRIDIH